MWDGINRRQFPRIRYKCLISIGTRDSSKTICTYTENIGVGGICAIIDEDLGLFQGVNLEIDLANGLPNNIKCNGTIVWVVKKHDAVRQDVIHHDTGIEFVDLDEEGKKRICKIIDEHRDDNNS
ncbi:MAG: PilZ domain-containing protein [Candidatus Omnitrophota bacterium]